MRIRSRWVAWVGAGLAVTLSKLLFMTCRKVFIGETPVSTMDHIPNTDETERYVLCVWHDSLLVPTFSPPRAVREVTCCLVSQHQDGSYLANAMAFLGYSTVRGSSRRGGAQAVRRLLDDTAGKHIVFTPDGPGGPRRVLKHGAVFVASQLGRKILPGAFTADRAWRLKGSWTDMQIPKPFSTVYIVTGEPIAVPSDLSREELDSYVQQAQQAMDRLNERIENMARAA